MWQENTSVAIQIDVAVLDKRSSRALHLDADGGALSADAVEFVPYVVLDGFERGGNGCLYFLLGVVRIFSKFGAGCIFFQYLVTNLFSMVRAKVVCIFWVIFFELFVTSVDIQAEFGRN